MEYLASWKLEAVLKGMETIMAALDDLRREVRENKTATDSAVALLHGLKAKLDEAIASGDMSQVQALADELSGQTDALASAIVQNTPAESGGGGTPPAPAPAP